MSVEGTALLHAGSGLDRLFGANAVSVVASLLQLLRLLEVAQLVVRNK